MNERINESLSALMDGEADELEVRRLLNQLEQDDELRATWHRYQLLGAVMRGNRWLRLIYRRASARRWTVNPWMTYRTAYRPQFRYRHAGAGWLPVRLRPA